MQTLTDILTGWAILILIVCFLAGCSNTVNSRPDLPPIYLKQSDLTCMVPETKRQIAKHNCKVDYDPKYCKEK